MLPFRLALPVGRPRITHGLVPWVGCRSRSCCCTAVAVFFQTKIHELRYVKPAPIFIVVAFAALVSGCAAPVSTPQPTAAIRANLLDPWPGPAPRPILPIDGFAGEPTGRSHSTIYSVERCDQHGNCTTGVAKPQVEIRITASSPTTVSFEAKVDYSVSARQTIGNTSGASSSTTTISVPQADSMHRVYVERATLKYGEERRLDLPHGESLIFCARQIQGQLGDSDHACEPPSTADQVKAIPKF